MFQIFCDGEDVLKKFREKYVTHTKGFFILAPSGSGKTYFVKNQAKQDWIDGDEIWMATNAHPQTNWWTEGIDVINEVEQKSDIITKQAKEAGLWIMGASCYWLMPDAIVLPDWSINKKYIKYREANNYDGGAKSDALDQVKNHRKYMQKIARKNKIPIFKSIGEAVDYLKNI
ncbi:MAG: hypothetical protein WC682_04390 [Parcubacteria group bacterium]|jgi:hypothetical protein